MCQLPGHQLVGDPSVFVNFIFDSFIKMSCLFLVFEFVKKKMCFNYSLKTICVNVLNFNYVVP